MIENAGYISPEGRARLDKYGSTLSHDNVRLLIERIEDYPEVIAAVHALPDPTPARDEALRDRVARVLGEALARTLPPADFGRFDLRWDDVVARVSSTQADALLGVLADSRAEALPGCVGPRCAESHATEAGVSCQRLAGHVGTHRWWGGGESIAWANDKEGDR